MNGTLLIGVVAVLGAAGLIQASLGAEVYSYDVPVILLLAAGAGIAQRQPVFLFRSSAISVAFAATIATYVLYGTGVALWVNLASAAVNAFTPSRKPLRKIAFNTGALTLSAYVAGTVFDALGGHAPGRGPATVVLAVAISALAYFGLNSTLTATIIGLTTPGTKVLSVWRENYSWMIVNYVATATSGAGLALSYEAISTIGIAIFTLPILAGWATFRAYMVNSQATRKRIAELERSNEALAGSNTALASELEKLVQLSKVAR